MYLQSSTHFTSNHFLFLSLYFDFIFWYICILFYLFLIFCHLFAITHYFSLNSTLSYFYLFWNWRHIILFYTSLKNLRSFIFIQSFTQSYFVERFLYLNFITFLKNKIYLWRFFDHAMTSYIFLVMLKIIVALLWNQNITLELLKNSNHRI